MVDLFSSTGVGGDVRELLILDLHFAGAIG
jgi:hypothetical protein